MVTVMTHERAPATGAPAADASLTEAGALAPQNRIPFAVDVATGLLFFAVGKATDLQTAALVGVAVGVALVLFQRLTRIDVTGGLVLFGILMMAISAGLAILSDDDAWIKLRGTITGLIGAAFFLVDGWRGGPYIGRGLARYMPYDDIDRARLALGMGGVGLVMAGLNYAVARLASTDHWLIYQTFLDLPIVVALAAVAMSWSRRGAAGGARCKSTAPGTPQRPGD